MNRVVSIRSFLGAIALFMLALTFAPQAFAQVDQQQTVNQAGATIERLKGSSFGKDFSTNLVKAKAVLIIPDYYQGGFIFGGQYGNAVLLARKPDGTFGYPAFYAVSGSTIGFQIGLQDISAVFLVQTEQGLDKLLTNHFIVGADAGFTFAVWGVGAGQGTTGTMNADIVAYAFGAVGFYGNARFNGAVVSARDSWNKAYYGRTVEATDIVMKGAATNSEADRLREILAH